MRIAYFDFLHGKRFTGAPISLLTSGSRATMASDARPAGYAVRGGRLVDARLGRRVRRFEVDGRRMVTVAYGARSSSRSPAWRRTSNEVEVYLGWFAQASRLMSAGLAAIEIVGRVPGVRGAQRRRFEKALQVTGQGPDGVPDHAACRTVAVCADAADVLSSRVDVQGPPDGYRLSGRLLAWGARRLAEGGALGAGACGPVDAFGLDVLEREVGRFGLVRI